MELKAFEKSDRLTLVRQLRVRGKKINDIANSLDVTPRQVYRDLAELRELARKRAVSAEHWQELGDGLDRYDDLSALALADYEVSTNEGARAKFLKLAITGLEKKLNLLVNCGIIPRAPTQYEYIDTPIEQLSLAELKNRRLAIVREIVIALPEVDQQKLLESAIAETEDQPIELEGYQPKTSEKDPKEIKPPKGAKSAVNSELPPDPPQSSPTLG